MSDAQQPQFSETVGYRVRFDESDPSGLLRTSGLLRYAQDSAWIHSEQLGFGREWYAERGLWWLVRCAEVLVTGPVHMGETVSVTTRIVGYRKVWARRRTEVAGASGEVAATLLTDWVITDSKGAPTRVPPEFVALFGGQIGTFTPGRVLLPPLDDSAAATRSFAIRQQDLDPMAHVNNAAYLDFFEESLVDAGHAAWLTRLPRRYRLEYVAAAEPASTVTARLWPTGKGFAFRLSGSKGEELVRATADADATRQAFRDAVDARLAWTALGKSSGHG
jgi:acyl-ACP thioesterase